MFELASSIRLQIAKYGSSGIRTACLLASAPLPCSLYVRYNVAMTQPDSQWLAQSLLNAPGWARVALTAPNEHLRENAALELAQTILAAWDREPTLTDARQMTLPL